MKTTILTSVFNDWTALKELLRRLDRLSLPEASQLRVVVVNDGSGEPMPADLVCDGGLAAISSVAVLDLACNLGHQRALALGIAVLAEKGRDDIIVVMDSDGEDDPSDVLRLVSAWRSNPAAVVVAERKKRSEGLAFRAGYLAYQLLFRILVGRPIRFGNFCAFGQPVAKRLAYAPDTWNHLAAALLRSGLPIVPMPTHRARRYAGKPSTNIPSLLAHGLSAFAVFSDRVFARLLLMASLLAGGAVLAALIIALIRFTTDLAIPGWATSAVGTLAILFVLSIVICLVASVQLLAARSQIVAVPAKLVADYVLERRLITGKD
jgi:hypothetical protein